MDLRAVAPTSASEAYAVTFQSELVRWSGAAWSLIEFEPDQIGETTVYPRVADVAASSPSDVWAVGGPIARHFDGNEWSTWPIAPNGDRAYLRRVAVQGPNHAWALGAHPFRWDGKDWSQVFADSTSGCCEVTEPWFSAVAATSASEAWLIGFCCGRRSLWRGDRTALSQVRQLPEGTNSNLWGTSGQDLWLAPSPLLHFGETFREMETIMLDGDLPVFAVSGTGASDVWLLGQSPSGSVIRPWKGLDARTVDDPSYHAPVLLSAIARAPGGELWVVGEGSATLQLPPPPASHVTR
jgi:hypothetical protein